MPIRTRTTLSFSVLAMACSAQAQSTPAAPASVGQLDTIVITGQRTREPSFDVPAAISAVTRDTIERAIKTLAKKMPDPPLAYEHGLLTFFI